MGARSLSAFHKETRCSVALSIIRDRNFFIRSRQDEKGGRDVDASAERLRRGLRGEAHSCRGSRDR